NRAGEEVLRDGIWLSYVGDKLTAGKDLLKAGDCAAAIRDVLAGTGAALTLERASTGAQRVLLTTPIGRDARPYAPVPPNAAGLLWLLPDRPAPGVIEHMAQLFELTPAESRLLEQLADEKDIK